MKKLFVLRGFSTKSPIIEKYKQTMNFLEIFLDIPKYIFSFRYKALNIRLKTVFVTQVAIM